MNTIRADHVGSLLRPKRLLDARRAYEQGKLGRAGLTEIEDEAIKAVLSMQKEAGIEIFSDGELRRSSWLEGPFAALEGLTPRTTPRAGMPMPLWKGEGADLANEAIPLTWAIATKKIRFKERMTGKETQFLKRHAPGPYKITMPSPTMLLSLYEPDITGRFYSDREAFLDDLVMAFKAEVDAQIADGASYIQLDSLRHSMAISGFPGPIGEGVSDVKGIVAQTIAADNAVLSRAKKKGVTRAIHICRGNHRSAWVMQGPYDAIAEQLFSGCDVDRFLLEYDDERSGSFAPLRHVPKGKIVVLGLVSSKLAKLESQEELMRRIDEAARYLPLDQLALSPQCGFASTELGNLLSEDEERRKLELVADTARRIWG